MRPLRGIAFKLASVLVFIVMASMIKATAQHVPAGQTVFFRSFFAIPVIFVWLALLMLQLQSFSLAAMVLLTAPFGIVGAAVGLLTFRMPFGFVAMLGVIALMGIIMRNTIILIDQIKQDMATGTHAWIAAREAAVRRFRPISLTAAAAVLAMIPLTRSVLWGPMAVAIMAGLIIATVLTILAVPAIYATWYRVKRPIAT